MSKRLWILVPVGVLVAVSTWVGSRRQVASAQPAAPARRTVELTVYPQDFGLVREIRPVRLVRGANRLQVLEVSKQLDPQSVLLRWQSEGANLPQLIAHSYDLGVANRDELVKRYLGREVELLRYGQNGREAERQRGQLMVESGGLVLQSGGKFYINPMGTLVTPAAGEIVTIPQLSVQAESPAAQPATLEIAYLTRGLSWSADYVGTLAPEKNVFSLECWATVTNRTSVDYPDAKVALLAGSPNRAVYAAKGRWAELYRQVPSAGAPAMAAPRAPSLPAIEGGAPESVGDLHAYPIKGATTVVQDQMNRLLMLSSTQILVVRNYTSVAPQLSFWYDDPEWGSARQSRRRSAEVGVEFENTEKAGLGVPLPRGTVRVYEPDRSGSLRYAGASQIQDTPKDQKLSLTLARAFDVHAEPRILEVRRLNRKVVRKRAQIVLHNEKGSAVEVRVVQPFGSPWKVVSQSHPHQRRDAQHAQWKIAVPSDGRVTLAYTVDVSE